MKADNIRLRGAASNGEDSAETDTLMNNMENNTDNNNNSNNTSAPLTVKIDSATDSSSSSSSSSASNNEANSNNNTISSPSANANGNIHPLAAALGMTSLGSLPAICFWIVMSCSVILFNKWLYNGLFSFPLTLTCIHMFFASTVTSIMRFMGKLNVPSFDRQFILRNIIPIGFLFACSLGLSNLAAVRLSVAFVQMIKALMPMMTLAVSVIMGLEKATTELAVVVSIMSFGVMIASYGEIHFEIIGFAFQLGSIVTESSRLVATQSLLQEHLPKGSSPLVSISLFAPASFLFLLPVALTLEPTGFTTLMIPEIGFYVLINTLVAFTLNIAVVILVAQTSGLVLTLAGIVKDILLIVASILLFGSPITYIQVFGYLLALFGLNCYHIYRGVKGNIELVALAKQAATNKTMGVMALGMLALSFFARSM